MWRSSFDRWFAAAGAVMALLAVVVALNLRNTHRLRTDTGTVIHTHEVLDALKSIDSHIREAESAQRTYIIVGGDQVSPEFAASIAAARDAITLTRRLTQDNPTQLPRLDKVESQVGELQTIWRRTIGVRQREGFEAARQVVAAGQSRRLMADLQSGLREAGETENQLLIERDIQTARTYTTAQSTGLISGIAAIAGVIAFILLMRRHLGVREAASVEIAEQAERLRTTLASIGDAVISTDREGRITNLNPVAETLTGWSLAEASQQPLDAVFRIVNETTREAAANPARRALAEGGHCRPRQPHGPDRERRRRTPDR